MRAIRFLDSCILASTIHLRPRVELRTEILHPAWIAPLSRERLDRLCVAAGLRFS